MNFKKIGNLFSAFVLISIIICLFEFSASAYTSDIYSYEVVGGCAVITGVDENASGDVEIPAYIDGYKVTTIGERAFFENDYIESIIIPDSVISLQKSAFSNCSALKRVLIPEGLVEMGEECFNGCRELADINIPTEITKIPRYAFGYCKMSSIIVPGNVKVIDEYAFAYCDDIEYIYIEDGVEKICRNAFFESDNVKEINISKTVREIDEEILYHNESLEKINVAKENQIYSSDSRGVLYTKDKTVLLQYPIGNSEKSYTIPAETEVIKYFAFNRCFNLTEIRVDKNNKYFSNDDAGVLFNKDKTQLIQYPVNNSRDS
ncbi:MAG: leucine-rich repeat domain-containing protein, partial [Lachnospiraceae bacterium]|nr:leucine-rich repeat domain-containing protein [Lachnospiraceae bacterium]